MEREKMIEMAKRFQREWLVNTKPMQPTSHLMADFAIEYARDPWVSVDEMVPSDNSGVWITTERGVVARSRFYDDCFHSSEGHVITAVAWMYNTAPPPFAPADKGGDDYEDREDDMSPDSLIDDIQL